MSRTSRRAILKATALAGSVAIGTGSVSGEIDSDAVPEDATIVYDEDRLETYQPLMSLEPTDREQLTGVYGYVAEYDSDPDVLCYWSRYAIQSGLFSFDSHQYDHEPVYVVVSGGEVLEVVYSGYHHYASRLEPTSEDLVAERSSDPTHVSMRVVSPYHHYRVDDAGSGAFYELRDWTSARSEWIEYGFYDGTSREAVDDPLSMRDRGMWWSEGTLDARFASIRLLLGLDPDDRDELEVE